MRLRNCSTCLSSLEKLHEQWLSHLDCCTHSAHTASCKRVTSVLYAHFLEDSFSHNFTMPWQYTPACARASAPFGSPCCNSTEHCIWRTSCAPPRSPSRTCRTSVSPLSVHVFLQTMAATHTQPHEPQIHQEKAMGTTGGCGGAQ